MTDNAIRNEKGLTLIELLITIGVGSIVIAMLMSILSTTLLTKNKADYENRLLDESYFISEYIQNRVFDLGVRSIETVEPNVEGDQILVFRHEYDIMQSEESGVIFRNYGEAESFVLLYDSEAKSLHYGSSEDFNSDQRFNNPDETRINSENVVVEDVTTLDFTCISEGRFYDSEVEENPDSEENENVSRCASAIIQINVTLSYLINDNPLFQPMTFESTIVF